MSFLAAHGKSNFLTLFLILVDCRKKNEVRLPCPVRNVLFETGPSRCVRVYSSAVRAADCRSAGPWFDSGCALFLGITESLLGIAKLAVFVKRLSRGAEMEMCNMEQNVKSYSGVSEEEDGIQPAGLIAQLVRAYG